jgi:hypothetical protein
VEGAVGIADPHGSFKLGSIHGQVVVRLTTKICEMQAFLIVADLTPRARGLAQGAFAIHPNLDSISVAS